MRSRAAGLALFSQSILIIGGEGKSDMEETIREYFGCWLNKDINVLREVFSDDVIYSECYGPEYRGIEQILRWFQDWNCKGTVTQWDIKKMYAIGKTVIAEWFFQCDYEGSVGGFNGVTIAEFDDNMKICNLKEFQSKAEHEYPYGK